MGSSDGKFLGAFFGGLLGGPWGALIGGVVGALLDDEGAPQTATTQMRQQQRPRIPPGQQPHQQRQHSRAHEAAPPAPPPDLRIVPYLRTLGLRSGVTVEQVKRRYKLLAREFHPDIMAGRGLDPSAVREGQETFKRISEAYQAVMRVIS